MSASLVKVLGFLLTESMENVQHYKMVVLREKGPWQPASTRGRRGRRRDSGGRGGDYGGRGSIGAMETYLCFWCQSAGVCFSEIDRQVHSIILTSGEEVKRFSGEKSSPGCRGREGGEAGVISIADSGTCSCNIVARGPIWTKTLA